MSGLEKTGGERSNHERLAYSMREAAEAIGICERSVWQVIKDGRLKAIKIGRSVRITREELLSFLREQRG